MTETAQMRELKAEIAQLRPSGPPVQFFDRSDEDCVTTAVAGQTRFAVRLFEKLSPQIHWAKSTVLYLPNEGNKSVALPP